MLGHTHLIHLAVLICINGSGLKHHIILMFMDISLNA